MSYKGKSYAAPAPYVSPQQIRMPPGHFPWQTGAHEYQNIDSALLPPGATCYLPAHPSQRDVTPQEVLRRIQPPHAQPAFAQDLRPVEYLSRNPNHSGSPFEKPINFAVGGVPGPYLPRLAKGLDEVDRPDDTILEYTGWSQTSVAFDFPGIRTPPKSRITIKENKRCITRQQFAIAVAQELLLWVETGEGDPSCAQSSVLAERWRLGNVKSDQLRLIAVNYYGQFWVPVFAVDVAEF
ncbi:hypothetical protein V5O48_012612 [Marasmius crinis-equi]|uniref:Uncharacterized protein n=1 Tax=Marasmius crinis-equi TaxID=585013 RepID=A0ABR3F2C1_9AGAR